MLLTGGQPAFRGEGFVAGRFDVAGVGGDLWGVLPSLFRVWARAAVFARFSGSIPATRSAIRRHSASLARRHPKGRRFAGRRRFYPLVWFAFPLGIPPTSFNRNAPRKQGTFLAIRRLFGNNREEDSFSNAAFKQQQVIFERIAPEIGFFWFGEIVPFVAKEIIVRPDQFRK